MKRGVLGVPGLNKTCRINMITLIDRKNNEGYAYEVPSDNLNALMKIFRAKGKAHGVMGNVGENFGYLNEFPIQESCQQSLS